MLRWSLPLALLALLPAQAGAQLISEQLSGDRRLCTYFGSETLPNDQVVARTVSVGLGQECPATAPFHDPDTPLPTNAALLREETTGDHRTCIYGQGGVEYQRSIPISARCAMTPALQDDPSGSRPDR